MSRAAPLTTATHWSADNPTHLGGFHTKLTRMCAAAAPTHRPPVARRPNPACPHALLSLYARRPISSCR